MQSNFLASTKEKAARVLRALKAARCGYRKNHEVIMFHPERMRNIEKRSTMLEAMHSCGLSPSRPLDLKADGAIHRYRVDGDKSGSVNGWYVLHDGAAAFGVFGSWKTGAQHQWRGSDLRSMSSAELAAMHQQMQAMQRAREAEALKVRAAAREKAQRLWARARPATNSHPYLQRKRVQAIGIRCLRDMLLIPLRDTEGTLHSLQFIGPDGGKRFLTGGLTAGCYCSLGNVQSRLLICEGYATGATLWQATGDAVAVAFNAGNLKAVAVALRRKFPSLNIVVCGDNDAQTEGNPGLRKATEAAMAVGGSWVVPSFGGASHV